MLYVQMLKHKNVHAAIPFSERHKPGDGARSS
jgi:hypothetical protein